jgi:peptide/nickel transport system substrate-binding protein
MMLRAPDVGRSSRFACFLIFLLLGTQTAIACAPQSAPSSERPDTAEQARPQSNRTLVIATRFERESIAGTLLHPLSGDTGTLRRVWNAGLAQGDGDNNLLPYLAESLPQLNTEAWRVLPDGRMETTYRLRPNLTWHDGAPLTAEDFVFAWRVYAAPELGRSGSTPHRAMEEAVALNPQTLLIRWRQPYPDAGALQAITDEGGPSFSPLPRHILESSFQGEAEAFLAQPYWTVEYVAAGPYRVDRWEPGAFIEGAAFDQHAWGRPKIDRIRVIFQPDANPALTGLLAGETHIVSDQTIRIEQGQTLKREWDARAGGTVVYRPQNGQYLQFQHRPEYANPRAILDLRVRRAIAYSVDKQGINEGLFEGVGVLTDTMMPPSVDYFAALDRAVTKYPQEPRLADANTAEAGYQKGPDGFYAGPDGRLTFEFKTNTSVQNDSWRAILQDGWKRAGIDVDQSAFTAGDTRDAQNLATFRSMYGTGGNVGESALPMFTSAMVARPENRWDGRNRGGWSNPEYDRLVDAVQTTLNREERVQRIIQAFTILTEQLGAFPLWFPPSVVAYVSELRGVNFRAADAEPTWNIHEWELR